MDIQVLYEIYERALSNNEYNRIGEIVSLLNNLEPQLKIASLSFYKKIEEELFQRGIEISNLDSNNFTRSIDEWQKENNKPVSSKILPKEEKKKKYKTFDESFISFYNRQQKTLSELKDYYFYKFESTDQDIDFETKIIILCCDTSLHIPALNYLCENEKNIPISKYTINSFAQSYKNGFPKGIFICLLVIAPNLNGIEAFQQDLDVILNSMYTTYIINIKQKDHDISIEDYDEIPNNDKAISILKESTNKIFNNKILSYDIQRIIKSFFGTYAAIIDYRILNPGASGSSVIEVQSIPIHGASTKRYVIKIARKTSGKASKLKKEFDMFKDFVKDTPTKGTTYIADYKETEIYEAIQYNYASSGSVNDAYSFAEILTEYLSPVPKKSHDIISVIEGLLKCELFKGWNALRSTTKKSCLFYKDYLKKENEILEVIRDINDKEVDTNNLIRIFNKVKEHSFESNEKVCHGDLHSDNFFWDGESVTLIDFGFTSMHHSIVDHTFLEMSIRLKHIPKSIPLNELIEYEMKFLDKKSFEPNFDLSFVKREKLRTIYQLINKIRVDSMKYIRDKNSLNEYLISLFIISFRQIQFQDLNQLYGLKIVALLSNELDKIL